jgi:hypothetical protein
VHVTVLGKRKPLMARRGRRALPNEGHVSVETVRDRMRATLAVIRDEASPELADRLSALIEPLWR